MWFILELYNYIDVDFYIAYVHVRNRCLGYDLYNSIEREWWLINGMSEWQLSSEAHQIWTIIVYSVSINLPPPLSPSPIPHGSSMHSH